MIPTRRTPLGVTGHRPLVGNLDGHEVVDAFAARNLVPGQVTTRLVERRQTAKKPGTAQPRSVQAGCARHRRAIARTYPAGQYPPVGRVIDKAPGHQGAVLTAVLAEAPPLERSPLPSSRPKLPGIERCGKGRRRRATHHRRFRTLAALNKALRHSRGYDQTLKPRVRSVMQASRKRTKSSAS